MGEGEYTSMSDIHTVPYNLVIDSDFREDLSSLYKKHGYILEWVAQTQYVLYDMSSKRRVKALLNV